MVGATPLPRSSYSEFIVVVCLQEALLCLCRVVAVCFHIVCLYVFVFFLDRRLSGNIYGLYCGGSVS